MVWVEIETQRLVWMEIETQHTHMTGGVRWRSEKAGVVDGWR